MGSIDAVMSHYATDARRINLFESWSCAGDNGIDVNNGSDSTVTLESNDAPTAASWWKNYYSSEVIGSKKSDSSHNGKMKRGHKITACLLRWAANMQLNNIHRQKYRCFDGTKKAVLNHEIISCKMERWYRRKETKDKGSSLSEKKKSKI